MLKKKKKMPLKYRNLAETKLKQKLMATLMTLIVIFLNLNILPQTD